MSHKAKLELPYADWPIEDRRRWEEAFRAGDRFDESGPGAHLAAATQRVLKASYARFLSFLLACHPDRLALAPEERINREIVAGYLAWRRRRRRDLALITELHHLRGALTLICPNTDWSWLLRITKRIAATMPQKVPRYNLVTSERLYAVGTELMDRAVAASDSDEHVSKATAFAYRDGLLIALLACIPLRGRTLVALRIGKHLVKSGKIWALDIPADDVKGRRPLDYPISQELSARIDVYLERFRCRIPGADRHRGLWASNKGRPMSSDAVYTAVCHSTEAALGFAVSPHRFRHAVGSFWSAHDPANVRGVADILGHASFGTTEKHYMMAQSRLAGRVLQQAIDRACKRPSPKRAGKPGQRMR